MIFESVRIYEYGPGEVGDHPLKECWQNVDIRMASDSEWYAFLPGGKLVAMIHTFDDNPVKLTDCNSAWVIEGILEEVIDGVLQPLFRKPDHFGEWVLTPYSTP